MKKDIQKEFDEIAEETQERCDQVKCSKKDYIEGMEIVISMLESAIDCSKEELRREEK